MAQAPEKRPILILDGKVIRYRNLSVKPIREAIKWGAEITHPNGARSYHVRKNLETSLRDRSGRIIFSLSS